MAQADSESGWRGRLAEIEEQLHALATELAADLEQDTPDSGEGEPLQPHEPLEPLEPLRAGGAPPPASRLTRALRPPPPPADPTLEAMCGRLLASMRELLAGYELAVTHVGTRAAPGPAVTVAAGPFASVALLEAFESALRTLPDVRGVSVRGYEGADHAVLEVQLAGRVS